MSESASSDTTAPAGDNVTAADTSAATEYGAAAQQSAEHEVEGITTVIQRMLFITAYRS